MLAAVLISFAVYYCLFGIVELAGRKRFGLSFVLAISCILLSIMSGFRSIKWPDTFAYTNSFNNIPDIIDIVKNGLVFSIGDYGIKEPGFFFVCAIVKAVTENPTIFFLIIAVASFVLLYKFLTKYSVFPIIGFCVYLARFVVTRNFEQIRAALAILIVIFSIRYIYKSKLVHFLMIVVVASLIHYSAVIVLPLYWLGKIKLSFKQVCLFVVLAFIVSFIFQMSINSFAAKITDTLGVGSSYTGGTTMYTIGKGLSNLMIYYQVALLLITSKMIDRIQRMTPYGIIIRNCYLYSTLILIAFSSLLVLSARLSTIYATLEVCIIPAIIMATPQKQRHISFMAFGGVMIVFLFINLNKVISIL